MICTTASGATDSESFWLSDSFCFEPDTCSCSTFSSRLPSADETTVPFKVSATVAPRFA